MSSAVITKRLTSREEYHKMVSVGLLQPDEKVELINGEIYNMAPIGSKHFAVVNKLTKLFVQAFDDLIISVQNPIHIDRWSEPEPDIVLLNYKQDEYFSSIPQPRDVLAVIEVSNTSREFDEKVKLPLYASAGIAIFWLVDVDGECVEEYANPDGNKFLNRRTYKPGEQITLQKKPFEVSEILILER